MVLLNHGRIVKNHLTKQYELYMSFFLQVILVLLVFSCKNPHQNIHGAVDT